MNKKYMVLFTPDFNCKVNSFNLYIIGNYVKRTIGKVYTANGVTSCAETINNGSLRVLFLLFYNLITTDQRTFANQSQIN